MTEPKHPQCEFDFEQYQEPRRVAPMAEYFREAFGMNTLGIVPSKYMKPGTGSLVTSPVDVERVVEQLSRVHTGNQPILSTDSAERKATPIWSGWLQYFPLAHAAAARHSKRMNDKHNPGEPMHWAREKSKDHEDCASRHLIDVNHFNEETQEYEEACSLFWRAGAILQLLEEKRLGRSPK